jgi:undecaprenyl-phosphate 4-deoxy-4-formamido-L-arabinose transferase
MISLSIIVPYFKSPLIEDLILEILDNTRDFHNTEIIIVDDSGIAWDGSFLEKICREVNKVKYIELSKNFGQHNAIIAGISFAKNDYVVTIDDDFQNPPNEIKRLAEYLIQNNLDLVYGSPINIRQTYVRKIMSKTIRSFLYYVLKVKNVNEISSFRIFKRKILDISSANVSEISIDSLLNWATDHIGYIKVDHNKRITGTSNYDFRKLFSFALNTIISYSVKPLKIATYFGILIFGIGAALLVFILGKYLLYGINVPGFTTTVSIIILFSGTQLIILGVIGEYLARMHLNIMNKPAFVVRRTIGFD